MTRWLGLTKMSARTTIKHKTPSSTGETNLHMESSFRVLEARESGTFRLSSVRTAERRGLRVGGREGKAQSSGFGFQDQEVSDLKNGSTKEFSATRSETRRCYKRRRKFRQSGEHRKE